MFDVCVFPYAPGVTRVASGVFSWAVEPKYSMMLRRITAAETAPITLAQLKAHLGYSTSDHDTRLTAIIGAATQYLESLCDRSFGLSTWELVQPHWEPSIRLPKCPVTQIVSVKAWTQGTQQTINTSNYHAMLGHKSAHVVFAWNYWLVPDIRPDAITVRFIAGEDNPSELVQQCILIIAGWLDQDREANRTEADGVARIVEVLRNEVYA